MRAAATLVSIGLVLVPAALPTFGSELQGAQEAVKQITERPKSPAPENSLPARFHRELTAFQARAATLPPDQAASEWLRLANQFPAAKSAERAMAVETGEQPDEALGFSTLIASLPPPQAWSAIAGGLEEEARAAAPGIRPVTRLMLAHLLRGDPTAVLEDADGLEALLRRGKKLETPAQLPMAYSLLEHAASLAGDRDRLARVLALRIDRPGSSANEELVLPDLVPLFGEARASSLLRKALLTSREPIRIDGGPRTVALSRRLALELVSKLRTPQWDLAETLEGAPLYAALAKRFPEHPEQPANGGRWAIFASSRGDRSSARAYTFLAEAARGRLSEAATHAAGMRDVLQQPSGNLAAGLRDLDRIDGGKRSEELLRRILTRSPDLSLWDEYLIRASRLGHDAAALRMLDTARKRPGITPATRWNLDEFYYRALLARGRTAEGVATLRERKTRPQPEANAVAIFDAPNEAVLLAQIGDAEGNAEWRETGIRAARDPATEPGGFSSDGKLAELLERLGRRAEAEEVLFSGLSRAAHDGSNSQSDECPQYLATLCGLYSRAGRQQDVLYLLDRAPRWQARNLADILLVEDYRGTNLGTLVAGAWAARGDKKQAGLLLRRVIRAAPAVDAAYDLLLRLESAEAFPFLDDLIQNDRWERRPLIWKARLLQTLGRLPEAEAAARAAITPDPGSAPRSRAESLRAEDVLAEILIAAGKRDEAATLREESLGARLGEEADKKAELGLTRAAIERYREAIEHCPRSASLRLRLAHQLITCGPAREVNQVLREGLERRMHAVDPAAEFVGIEYPLLSSAEHVAEALVADHAGRPRADYVLGCFSATANRYVDAARRLQAAVRSDPEHLGAWYRLSQVEDEALIPWEERDRITLTLLRLDPSQRHSDCRNSSVLNLRALWQAQTEAARHEDPSRSDAVYPLQASTTYLEFTADATPGRVVTSLDGSDPNAVIHTPGERIAAQRLVTLLAGLIDNEK